MRLMILFLLTFTIAGFTHTPKPMAAGPSDIKGLNYTTLGATPQEPAAPKLINLKTIQPAAPINHTEPKKNSPMADVWNKYKELATGQSTQAPKPMAGGAQKISTPQKPQVKKPVLTNTSKQTPIKKTGFAGVIESFQKNKKTRGKMQSVTVNKP